MHQDSLHGRVRAQREEVRSDGLFPASVCTCEAGMQQPISLESLIPRRCNNREISTLHIFGKVIAQNSHALYTASIRELCNKGLRRLEFPTRSTAGCRLLAICLACQCDRKRLRFRGNPASAIFSRPKPLAGQYKVTLSS
jgi:hypothetical protein